MPRYTNVILLSDESFGLALTYVQDWLKEQGQPPLNDLGTPSGFVSGIFFGGTFPRLDLVRFIARVRTAPWDHPSHVQLFVKDEDDERWAERANMVLARAQEISSSAECPFCHSHQTYQKINTVGGAGGWPCYGCNFCGKEWVHSADGQCTCGGPGQPKYCDVHRPMPAAEAQAMLDLRDQQVEHRHKDYRGPPSQCPYCGTAVVG